jgi:hypothetical protein
MGLFARVTVICNQRKVPRARVRTPVVLSSRWADAGLPDDTPAGGCIASVLRWEPASAGCIGSAGLFNNEHIVFS